MSDQAAVLFANDAFYAAFLGRDPRAMDAVWSLRERVSCIHPGWPPLIGRSNVMQSWGAILGSQQSPKISCHQPTAFFCGEAAFVICYERVEGVFLVATNIFVRESGAWKMIHHQAGATPPPEEEEETPPQRLQ